MEYIDKKNYSRSDLNLDIKEIRNLEKIHTIRPWVDLFYLYFLTLFFVFASLKLTNFSYFFYPLVIFFIAGRQGAFLQLVHEASHRLISKNKHVNEFYGRWLTSYLLGINFQGYRSGHESHHTNTSTANEPISDSEKYAIVNFKDPKIYYLFFKDIIGISVLRVFFNYTNGLKHIKPLTFNQKILNLFKISLVQIIILSLFRFDIVLYILFWLYPAIGPHMFLMRIRGIAEHGLSKKIEYFVTKTSEGLYYTRSFLTNVNKYKFTPLIWVEKLLIGSFSVHYHHEHHLDAKIPHYNLKKFHEIVKNEVDKKIITPIYEKGYFSAAFRTVKVPKEHLS